MRYLVYQTTNLINGKLYIGVHATDKLDDGYLGSGTVIKRPLRLTAVKPSNERFLQKSNRLARRETKLKKVAEVCLLS